MSDAVCHRMDCIVTVSGTGCALLHGDLVFMYVSFSSFFMLSLQISWPPVGNIKYEFSLCMSRQTQTTVKVLLF